MSPARPLLDGALGAVRNAAAAHNCPSWLSVLPPGVQPALNDGAVVTGNDARDS